MIRRHQVNYFGILPVRTRQVLDLSRWTVLSLASLFVLGASASAQFTPDGSRIEFLVPSDQQAPDPLGPNVQPFIQGEPSSFAGWGHGAGPCCGDCPPMWRIRAEGLLLKPEVNNGFTLSDSHTLAKFGYEKGARISVVRQLDCLDAWELAYSGPFEWVEVGQAAGVGLMSQLNSATVNLSEFNNATFHSQAHRSRLNSLEVNRRWYGWDVISTLYGLRYLDVDEDYLFNSTGLAGTGELASVTNNRILGPQLGMEIMYPLGNWMTTTKLKGAALANSADGSFGLVNAGVQEVAAGGDKLQFATLLELGYYFTYQITPSIKFRGGYELWWLRGVTRVPDQVRVPITTATGSIADNSDIYYHGAAAGIEVVW